MHLVHGGSGRDDGAGEGQRGKPDTTGAAGGRLQSTVFLTDVRQFVLQGNPVSNTTILENIRITQGNADEHHEFAEETNGTLG